MLGGSALRYWRRQPSSGIATQTKPTRSEAESSAAPQSSSRVDLERFRADLTDAGVEEMIGALLATFAEDAPIRLAALEDAARSRDGQAIERAAHAFKSGAGTIRATFLADMLAEIEAAGRTGQLEAASALIEPTRKEYLVVMLELEAAIGE
jgi:HPt (histidine-containing phosphotransfer) domain-containing protein